MGQPFIVMEFIPGRFLGSTEDLFLSANAIQDMHKGFSNHDGLSFTELQVLQSDANQILNDFIKTKMGGVKI